MNTVGRSVRMVAVLGTLVGALAACSGSSGGGAAQNLTAGGAGRFETFEGADGQTYFQMLAGNGECVLHSEGYTSLESANKGISSVRSNGKSASHFEVL